MIQEISGNAIIMKAILCKMLYNDVDEEQDSSLSADNDTWIPGSKSNNKPTVGTDPRGWISR